MMTDEQALSRPIGWWLKEAGARLDAVFDRSLQGCGLDRRGWQVLASLARRPTRLSELISRLSSFDPSSVPPPVARRRQVRPCGGSLSGGRAAAHRMTW